MIEVAEEKRMSIKEYLLDRMFKGSTGVAHAVFVTLGIGLLFETVGQMLNIPALSMIGSATKLAFAPALGAGIAFTLGANTLTMFSAMGASTLGAGALSLVTLADGSTAFTIVTGEPIGAVIAGIIATFIGKRVSGKTPLDMMAIPISAILIGGLAGIGVYQITGPALQSVSAFITNSVEGSPIIGSSVIALLWGVLLMSPASSAALSVALQLDPTASAAALIGCTVQFVAFSVMGMRENDMGGFLAQFICTPKVQLPNVVKNLKVLIPGFVTAIIVAPIATLLFGFQANSAIGGLGLCSLIAPLNIANTQGLGALAVFLGVGVVLAGFLSYGIYFILRKKGWIKPGDLAMKIE